MKRIMVVVFVLCPVVVSYAQSGEARAIWQDRWSLESDAEVQAFVNYADAHNCNIALAQVFGGGYALYPSSFVPHWYSSSPANFDSLAAAVTRGHALGLEVHAYINLCLVHQGSSPTPTNPAHLINAHPEWAMVNAAGVSDITKVGVAGTDIFYDPHQPGFRQYLIDVATEIVTNYDVDGVHLDYVRYPGANYCYCNLHKADFQAAYGRLPVTGDPDWDTMRFNDVTSLVSGISSAVRAVKPLCKVTAATWRTNRTMYQSPTAWLENGLLDAICPMQYTSDVLVFEDWVRDLDPFSGGRQIWNGILASGDKISEEVTITRNVGSWGQAIFEYSSMNNPRTTDLDSVYATPAAVPGMPWLDGSADTVGPLVAQTKAAVVKNTSALIRWHTDEQSNSRVDYGLTTGYGSTASNATRVFNHDVWLNNLSASTTYHFRVVSADASANTATSADFTFTTPATGESPVIIDDGDVDFLFSGEWYKTAGSGGYNNDYLWSSEDTSVSAWAEWRPYVPSTGNYKVYVRYRAGSNRCSSVPFAVYYAGGKQTTNLNQQINNDLWLLIGTFAFTQGYGNYFRMDNLATGGAVVCYDAVQMEPVGSGGGAPAAPSNLTATTVSATQINLAWTDNSSDETNFVVDRKQGTGSYSVIATLPANTTTYPNTGLAKNTSYTYRVKATNANGSSAYSNEATAKTLRR